MPRLLREETLFSARFLLQKAAGLTIVLFVDMEIMKAPASPTSRTAALIWCLLGYTSVAFAADVVLQKVPPLTVDQAPSYPQNLARYHLGAQLEPQTGVANQSNTDARNTSEAALLSGDPTVGYALPAGTTTLVVSLPNIENIDTVSFLNEGAKGSVSIATSNTKLPLDSPQWRDVGQQELSANAIRAKVGPSEAKYLKITFNVAEAGRIAGFGAYSTPAASDFTMPRPRRVNLANTPQSFALIGSNLTDLHAKARALYVSSGGDVKEANNMIDDQPASAYNFSADDAAPTVIIDLGKVSKLRRLSAIYSPRPGTVEFYVLQSLPSEQPAENIEVKTAPPQSALAAVSSGGTPMPNSYTLTDATASNMKAIGSVVNTEGEGHASIDFPETSGRYVMIKWIPASHSDSGFSVAEIAAFSGAKSTDETIASDDRFQGVRYADGKSTLDSKDVPAEGPQETPQAPGEGPPPNLPLPPPFTFIPEVVPTSP